jgi:hypothetical protein
MRNLVWVAALIGCGGGGSTPGEPLVSGSISASYAGNPFAPGYGFATVYMGSGLIGFAESAVHCGSEKSPDPPGGSGVIVQLPSLAAGNYATAYVQVFQNHGSYMAVGSMGTVDLTSVTTSVAGTLDFTFTDPSDGKMYEASGAFEVVNCMP